MRTAFRAALALAVVVALFAIPDAAQAHVSTAAISCSAETITYTLFADSGHGNHGLNTPYYEIDVDGVAVITAQASFAGSSDTVTVPYPLTGSHTVTVYTWWSSGDTRDGYSQARELVASGSVDCSTMTTTVTTPAPPITVTTTMVTTPAPTTTAGAPTETALPKAKTPKPYRAKLTSTEDCTTATSTVRVHTSHVKRVVFFVNGKRAQSGKRKVLTLHASHNGVDYVRALVNFTNETKRSVHTYAGLCVGDAVGLG